MPRPPTLTIVLAFVIGAAGVAGADNIRTEQPTPLRDRPSEAARIVARLDAGQRVRVMNRRGRWIEVRTKRARGWLTRTTVERVEPAGDRARRRRDRSGRRRDRSGWGRRELDRGPGSARRGARERADRKRGDQRREHPGEDAAAAAGDLLTVDVAAATAQVLIDPRASAAVVFEARAGDELAVVGVSDDGDWFLVQDADEQVGWIPKAAVVDHGVSRPASAAGARAEPGEAGEGSGSAAAAGAAPPRESASAILAAHAGARSLSRAFSSNGTSPDAVREMSAIGLTTGVRAELERSGIGGFFGADAGYQVSYATPGMHHEGVNVPFSLHELEAGGRAGYRAASGLAVYARLGVTLSMLFVSDLENGAKVARERLYGTTIGAGVDGTDIGPVRVGASIDTLVAGTRSQTPGLEDGAESTARAVWGAVRAASDVADGVVLAGRYRFGWERTRWAGQSNRLPAVTSATRTDLHHTLTVSLAHAF